MGLAEELDIRGRALRAAERIVADIHYLVRDKVSIDVERIGSTVIRSLPGEPPRRDTGEYWDSIGFDAEDTGDMITASAFSTNWKAPMLEYGTRYAARPHWGRVWDDYMPTIPAKFDEYFNND